MTRSVLSITWDGAGNLPPQRALLRALRSRGYAVRMLASPSVRRNVERDGVEFVPVEGVRRYDSLEAMAPEEEFPFVLEHVWFAKPFGTELCAAIERFRPDALLVDICLVHALAAARASGLPTAVVGHFPYQLLVGPFAPVVEPWMAAVNAYAGELGLAPFPSLRALVESHAAVLIPTYRQFDEVEDLAPNVTHVGPLRTPASGAAWPRRTPGRPLVLVALSTSAQHQAPLLQRLCDALGALDVEAVVTTGPAVAPASLRAAPNTTLVEFVPHDEVLPSASLLVTHAGHGTVMAGAMYGVPMLCLPMGRDQPFIADRVTRLGLGSVLGLDAGVAELRGAVTAMLGDRALATRVRDFARSVEDHPGLPDATMLLETLLR